MAAIGPGAVLARRRRHWTVVRRISWATSLELVQVALDLGRRAIGIEINPEYVALIQRRLTGITLGLSLEHSP